jgi:hypothetical protein
MSILTRFRGNGDHVLAHRHCKNHPAELDCSEFCGCFYCFAIYPPSRINQWIDQEQTALCPECEIDSVIGSASGFPITKEFLERIDAQWFS